MRAVEPEGTAAMRELREAGRAGEQAERARKHPRSNCATLAGAGMRVRRLA